MQLLRASQSEIRHGKVLHSITENFGIGADSLDESEFDLDDEQEEQDDIEDQMRPLSGL